MEAFVYKLTYRPTLDWYVGYHTGTEDDGYVCSSKVVMNLYNIDPSDWNRDIIARGTTKDMYELETTILETANARRDIRSFNRHNNEGQQVFVPGWSKGKKFTEEQCANMRGKKRKPFSAEHRANLSKAKVGKTLTAQHKENVSKGKKNYEFTEEHKANLQAARLNHCRKAKPI